ncbi:MAG: hypothetical protein Q9171_005473, partial [Xanthocarpia ochracea]
MSIRIQLQDARSVYTNLDFIRGKAILSLTRDEEITAVNVKLEGESRSRLEGEPEIPYGFSGRRRRREETAIETEVHKVLYKAITVFPTPKSQLAQRNGVFAIPPGQHEFPFEFKLPFNNSCDVFRPVVLTIGGRPMQAPATTDRHIKRALPPTLHAFEDQADIRYYVKATVVRQAFYKENFRTESHFPFFPIEPPRPPPNRMETYARRQHQFTPILELSATAESPSKSPTIPRDGPGPASPSNTSPSSSLAPLRICIESRLPDPAIITCNEPIPLRILITKLNDSPATVYLQSLQIELLATTLVRAHHLKRENSTSTVLISKSNMRIRLSERDKVMEIDKAGWNRIPLPNTVAPSFEICNITRSYHVLVQIGLTHGLEDKKF